MALEPGPAARFPLQMVRFIAEHLFPLSLPATLGSRDFR